MNKDEISKDKVRLKNILTEFQKLEPNAMAVFKGTLRFVTRIRSTKKTKHSKNFTPTC